MCRAKGKPEMTDGWTCSSCGSANGVNDVYCSACGTQRLRGGSGGRTAPTVGAVWRCGACETVNRDPASVCSACGTTKSEGSTSPIVDVGVEPTTVITRPAGRPRAPRSRAVPATAPVAGDTDAATDRSTRRTALILVGVAAAVVALVAGILIGTHSHGAPSPDNLIASPPPTASTSTSTSTTTTTTTLPSGEIAVDTSAVPSSPLVTQVASTLSMYFGEINAQNYAEAWSTYTPRYQAATPLATWESGYATTQESAVSLVSVDQNSDGSVSAGVNFTSQQAASQGYDGQTCSQWSLTFSLQPAGSTTVTAPDNTQLAYLIDTASGPEATAC